MGAFDAEQVETFGEVAHVEGVVKFTAVGMDAFIADGAARQVGDSEVDLAFIVGGEVNIQGAAGGVRIHVNVEQTVVFGNFSDGFVGKGEAVVFFEVVGYEANLKFVGVAVDYQYIFGRPVVGVDTIDGVSLVGLSDIEEVDEVASAELDLGIRDVQFFETVDSPAAGGFGTIGSAFFDGGVALVGDDAAACGQSGQFFAITARGAGGEVKYEAAASYVIAVGDKTYEYAVCHDIEGGAGAGVARVAASHIVQIAILVENHFVGVVLGLETEELDGVAGPSRR